MNGLDSSQDPPADGEEQEKSIQLFLARLEAMPGLLKLRDVDEPLLVELYGEMVVARSSDGESEPILEEIRRVALWTDPLEELQGQFSLAGPTNELEFKPGSTSDSHPIDMQIYYPPLSDLEPACTESDAVYPQLEHLVGELTWFVEDTNEEAFTLNVTITLEKLESAPLGMVESLSFGPATLFFAPMAAQSVEGPSHRSILGSTDPTSPCFSNGPSGSGTEEYRRLLIRFVNISTQAPPVCPIDDLAQRLYCRASEVWWQNGGIRIDIDPQNTSVLPRTFQNGIIDSNHETGQNGQTGIDTLSPDAGGANTAVDIYLVDQLTAWPGGGVTHNCGTPSAFVILQVDKACYNDYVLAHELGHALGLLHPDNSGCGFQLGTYCSVMVPENPNSHRNTLDNYHRIVNPGTPSASVFASLNQQGVRLDPFANQTCFHILRDFPCDDGREASVPQAPASAWWTHSDVWNSTSTTPLFNPDHSPISSNVQYSGTNYMFVRLHACRPLLQVAKVYLYLTTPGSATSPLTFLTAVSGTNPLEFSGNNAPKPGLPKWLQIGWTVPAGALSHSCVFAIADSPGQDSSPETAAIRANPAHPNLTTLQFFNLVKTDHNYAQRNLNIPGAPAGSNTPLPMMLAWVQMDNPFDQAAPASLEIDATQLAGLESLALEVDGKIFGEIKPGEKTSVLITDALQPGDRKILRFHATLRDTKLEGMTFPLHLQFRVKDELVSGFSHVIRVVPLSEAVFQVLDQMYGALRNVAVGCGSEAAVRVADRVAQILARERIMRSPGCLGLLWRIARTQNTWKTEVRLLGEGIFAVAADLKDRTEPECQVLHRRLGKLAELLLTSKSTSSHLLVQQIRSEIDYVSQPAVQLIGRKKRT